MELYLGLILESGLNFEPRGMMACDGRLLSIQQWPAMFSLLGPSYGGDGIHNFALPDLRPVDQNGNKREWNYDEPRKLIVVEGIFPSRP